MAIVILGGLVTSTILNLFFLPALYLLARGGRRGIGRVGAKGGGGSGAPRVMTTTAAAPAETSFPKSQIRVLLLENVHASAHEIFRAGGLPGRDVRGGPRGGRPRREGPRRARPRDPEPDPGHRAGALRGPPPAHARHLLHRHEPGRPRRRQPARRPRLQRAVQQHPQRRGAGDRRDHRPRPPARGPLAGDARGPVEEGRALLLRGPRQDARHRRLRPHRHAGRRPRRGGRHAGALPRHRAEAADGQQPPGGVPGGGAGPGRLRHPARPGDAAHPGPRRRAASSPG